MYHAQNTYPYPEDQNVAEWVREEGEPNNWVHFNQEMPESTATSVKTADKMKTEKSKPEIKTRTI